MTVRAAFVMEETLGHVTHYRNLREAASRQTRVEPTWLPIPFAPTGPARFVPVLRSNWSVRASWRARRALDAALTVRPLETVFFHTQVTALFSLGVLRRRPCVVSFDATPINYDSVGRYYGHRPAGGGPLDRQKYLLNRRVFQAAAALVTWSEWARRSTIDDYGVDASRVRVLAPGAAEGYFAIGAHRRAGAARPSRDRVRLLFVGGDFERKGGPLLLDCVSGELAERSELHVVTRDGVPSRPGVHVHRGLAPNSPELLQLFADADAFVLPSFAECMPVAVMEAAAAGLPVVATDVGAVREAVVDGLTGMLIPAGGGRALRAALDLLVADAGLRARLGRAANEYACQRFDAQRNDEVLLGLVAETALQGHSGAAA